MMISAYVEVTSALAPTVLCMAFIAVLMPRTRLKCASRGVWPH